MNNAHSPFTAIESAQILVEGLIQHGLAGAVVSPGSRNAPLLQALDNAGVPCKVALDERSAAHHALGMACALNAPVVVCCTSGTAALNHGPALAEAFKVGLPLISLTADRPPGAQDQWESQTLQQFGVHAPHGARRLSVAPRIAAPKRRLLQRCRPGAPIGTRPHQLPFC